MTFSAEKLRFTNVTPGGTGNNLPAIIQCGELVDSNLEIDVMVLQDVSGSYPASQSVPFVKRIASCILTSWPNAYIGLCYFSDFPISPYGFVGDVPFGIQETLQPGSYGSIDTWNLPQLNGNDSFEAQLDAIKQGAESTAFGWRPIVPGRKRFIVLNTDQFPHDKTTEPSAPHTTRAATVQACIDNEVWPLYVLTNDSYNTANTPYDLQYGVSGLGTPNDLEELISQILTGIYTGIVQ